MQLDVRARANGRQDTQMDAGQMMAAKRSQLEIDARLSEWGRWARARQTQGRCASIEHLYLSKLRPDMTPTGWGDWIPEVPAPILPPINPLQALAVERVMRHLPDGHRKALKLRYVYRMAPRLICLRLVIRPVDYERYVGDAQRMVANLLQRAETEHLTNQRVRNIKRIIT